MTVAGSKTITADVLDIDVTALSMAQDSTLAIKSNVDIDASGDVILHHVDAETAVTVNANTITLNGHMMP